MKTLKQLKSDKRIEEISVEYEMVAGKSYFVYLNKGFSLDMPGEQHCFGEDNLREVNLTLKRVVKCDCDQCSSNPNDPGLAWDQPGSDQYKS